MPAPKHISEVLKEIAADWPIMATPDYTGRASCLVCRGAGEREYIPDGAVPWNSSEPPSYYAVSVPCTACNGTGDAPTLIACPSCGHDQYDHAPDGRPPYACTLLGCRCSRTPDHLIVEAPAVA